MVETIRHIRQQVARALKNHQVSAARQEAQWLLEKVTGQNGTWLLLHQNDPLTDAQRTRLGELVVRRCQGEPLQYLLGFWEFYGRDFAVGPGVLIPRPETELLCSLAISQFAQRVGCAVDLCAGSGCIALTLKTHCPGLTVCAVEYSCAALEYLEKNVQLFGLEIPIIQGDVCQRSTADSFDRLDLIVSNPPYLTADEITSLQREVRFEPPMALDGGEDGLDFYRRMLPLWLPKLNPDGMIAFEVGDNQAQAVQALLAEFGCSQIASCKDENQIERVVYAIKR